MDFGVLGYAGRLDQAMQDTGNSFTTTENMAQYNAEARSTLANFYPANGTGTWSDELITQLQQVLAAGGAAAAADPASQAATLANQILNGSADTGGAAGGVCGCATYRRLLPQEAGAAEPEQPPVDGVNTDTFENDDLCSRANVIASDGAVRGIRSTMKVIRIGCASPRRPTRAT